MKKMKLMFFAIGHEYEYDENKIQVSDGIISKKIDTINFIDIKDITTTKNLFGWGTISITDINGTKKFKYVKNTKDIHNELNNIFLEHKSKMQKVDIS